MDFLALSVLNTEILPDGIYVTEPLVLFDVLVYSLRMLLLSNFLVRSWSSVHQSVVGFGAKHDIHMDSMLSSCRKLSLAQCQLDSISP